MSFTNIFFILLFALLLCLILIIQTIMKNSVERANRVIKLFLLFFSYYIISTYDIRFCTCILSATVFNYVVAVFLEKQMSKDSSGKMPGILKVGSVIVNILFLGYFKYTNFFGNSICNLVGKEWNSLNIILPIGISFYVFSLIGYILDVSYGIQNAEHDFFDFALYVSFFPKIVCGPIVPGKELLPQIKKPKKIKWLYIERGLQIFSVGLFKKAVIADHIGVFVKGMFNTPKAYSGLSLLVGIMCYTAQLYFDFSGYSDMAIGAFNMLGYDVERNFNLPFTALTVSEYWNRWHISLSTWLKDYVHTPVGISIKRKMASLPKEKRKKYKNVPSYIAVLVTFLISGFWHGAGWNFVLYGLSYGIILIIQTFTRKSEKVSKPNSGIRIILTVWNFIMVCFINVLFRADSVSAALDIYKQIFTMSSGISYVNTWGILGLICILGEIIFFIIYRKKHREVSSLNMEYITMDLTKFWSLVAFFTFLGLIVMMAYVGETFFIYGNF